MGIENQRYAVVNRSSSYIPVYKELVHSSIHTGGVTAGGSQIGKIYPNEFYLVFPNSSMYVTSFKIRFRDINGNPVYGYIETSEGYTLDYYAWNAYQEPYNYYNSNGSTLVNATTATIDGKKQYIFTVTKRAATAVSPDKSQSVELPVGTKIATDTSTIGQTLPDYMLFRKKKVGNSWVNIVSSSSYAFVDLGLSNGNMPNNRNIR